MFVKKKLTFGCLIGDYIFFWRLHALVRCDEACLPQYFMGIHIELRT